MLACVSVRTIEFADSLAVIVVWIEISGCKSLTNCDASTKRTGRICVTISSVGGKAASLAASQIMRGPSKTRRCIWKCLSGERLQILRQRGPLFARFSRQEGEEPSLCVWLMGMQMVTTKASQRATLRLGQPKR